MVTSLISKSYNWGEDSYKMATFILWLILLFLAWPLALLALVLFPIVWLVLLPFRIVGIAVDGLIEFLRALIMFPARVLGSRR